MFLDLLYPRRLPVYAKRPGVIVLVSCSYIAASLVLIYGLYSLLTIGICKEQLCTHMMGEHSHLPNFLFTVFAAIATLAAAILAFCLVVLDYKEMTGLGQVASMIEDEFSSMSKSEEGKAIATTRFAIQDRGLIFGLLSDNKSWRNIFENLLILSGKSSAPTLAASHILINDDTELQKYLRDSLKRMELSVVQECAKTFKDVLQRYMPHDGACYGVSAKQLVNFDCDNEDADGLREKFLCLLMALNTSLVTLFKNAGVNVASTGTLTDEKYICFGHHACAYYVLPDSKANRIQGFTTNEPALVNFFFDLIERKVSEFHRPHAAVA